MVTPYHHIFFDLFFDHTLFFEGFEVTDHSEEIRTDYNRKP
jgi:hypothetical protein